MNPLERYPHLFANGKFKVRYAVNGVSISPWKIVGLNNETYFSLYDGQEQRSGVSIEDCTLIARPIEDMTNPELHICEQYDGRDFTFWRTTYLPDRASNGKLSRNELLGLLEFGVYPFDQSHFDDGIVIDSTTL